MLTQLVPISYWQVNGQQGQSGFRGNGQTTVDVEQRLLIPAQGLCNPSAGLEFFTLRNIALHQVNLQVS